MVSIWDVNKAYELKKFNFSTEGQSVERIIRGINLSFDEEYILIYNSNCLGYYNFTPFKQDISSDVLDRDKRDKKLIDASTDRNMLPI